MGKYATYDPTEKVISTDLTGLIGTPQIVDEVMDEIIAVAKTLPEKVFMIVCWKDVKMDPVTSEHYGQRLPDLLNYLRGIIRYDATEITTRLAIRAKNIKYQTQNAKTHIYTSKEEALAVVRQMEQENKEEKHKSGG